MLRKQHEEFDWRMQHYYGRKELIQPNQTQHAAQYVILVVHASREGLPVCLNLFMQLSPNTSTALDLLRVSSNAFLVALLLLAPKLLLELLQLPLHFVNSVCLNSGEPRF